METIHTDQAPKAVGPYSQAVKHCCTIYCAGQIGLDPETGELRKGLEAQTKQVMENLKEVVEEAGSSMKKVVKTTILLADIDDYAAVNEIYAEYFKENKPARSTFAVAALPKGALIEIDAVAIDACCVCQDVEKTDDCPCCS
jgi:2-iminobutanoate/2-iminopropanoate deaminase